MNEYIEPILLYYNVLRNEGHIKMKLGYYDSNHNKSYK